MAKAAGLTDVNSCLINTNRGLSAVTLETRSGGYGRPLPSSSWSSQADVGQDALGEQLVVQGKKKNINKKDKDHHQEKASLIFFFFLIRIIF